MTQTPFADLASRLHQGGAFHYLWRPLDRRTLWKPVAETLPDVPGKEDIYFGVHPTTEVPADGPPEKVRGRLECIGAVNCLFAEVDGKDFDADDPLGQGKALALAHLNALPLPPSIIVDSGGGYHAYWLLAASWVFSDAEERETARRLQAAWVEYAGGDKGAKDLARVLRVPGTINSKYPDKPVVTMVEFCPERTYTVEALAAAAQPDGGTSPTQRPERKQKPPKAGAKFAGTDMEVMQRALRSGHDGAKFSALWAGDTSEYSDDHSAADLALMNLLAFYTRGDAAQMERLFRTSGLAREKLDEKHRASDGATYLQITIEKALQGRGTADFWAPPDERKQEWPEFEATDGGVPPDGIEEEQDLCFYTFDDLGNGRRLIAHHGRNVRYVPEWRCWLIWNGRQWRRDRDGEITRLAIRTVDITRQQFDAWQTDNEELQKAIRKHRASMGSRRSLEAMEYAGARLPGTPVEPADLDANLDSLPCANGMVDLHAGTLSEHRRENLNTKCLSLPYAPDAACPTWDRFMDDVFRGDQELIAYVWRVLGYCLTGHCTERVFFILHGEEGKNGKSTLCEAWGRILEQDVFSSALDVRVLMEQRYQQGNQPELATLPGIRFTYTSEANRKDRFDVAKLKLWTGGDTVEACQKHERPFAFRPQFKLLISTNYRPEVSDISPAMWDRVRLLPFYQRFSNDPADLAAGAKPADPLLLGKLLAEAPGALARAIRGAMEFYEFGLVTPRAVAEATAEYRQESDLVQAFIDERCVVGEGSERASALYASYRSWCEANGRRPDNGTVFGSALTSKGFGKHRNNGIWRTGIRLIQDDFEYEPGVLG